MNGDGSAGVAADVAVGAKTGLLLPLGIGLLTILAVVLALGTAGVVLGGTGGRARPGRDERLPTPGSPREPDLTGVASR